MNITTLPVGDFTIRYVEHGHWYVRTGGEFVLTLMWKSWGIEICRRRSQDWAVFGTTTQSLGIRIKGLWFEFMFGSISGLVPPTWITRRGSWWCLVTSKDLWPDMIDC